MHLIKIVLYNFSKIISKKPKLFLLLISIAFLVFILILSILKFFKNTEDILLEKCWPLFIKKKLLFLLEIEQRYPLGFAPVPNTITRLLDHQDLKLTIDQS